VIRLAGGLAVAAPMLALGMPWLRAWSSAELLPYVYALIFSILGALVNANMAGFMNYILEIAPAGDRPIYVGLANTLSSLVLVAPFLGGWVLQGTSYTTLLLATGATCLAGLILSGWLEEPRRRQAPAIQSQQAPV